MMQRKTKKRLDQKAKALDYKALLRRVDQMSSKQRFNSMVAAGIYTQGGKLTAHYGGLGNQ